MAAKSILKTKKRAPKSKKRVRFNLDDVNDNDDETEHHKKLTAFEIAHRRNVLSTKDMFLLNYGMPIEIQSDIISNTMKLKISHQYHDVENHPLSKTNTKTKTDKPLKDSKIVEPPRKKQKILNDNQNLNEIAQNNINSDTSTTIIESVIDNLPQKNENNLTPSTAVIEYNHNTSNQELMRHKKKNKKKKPEWRRPWKLYKVISGHMGWVGAVCMDPSNEWFATGSADRTIKIWDLASGVLKLTLTGHISHVRDIGISSKSPYMFSCSEDKQVRCWDLETNRVIRHYHGHLSGVYCLSLHPTLNILFTGGRDSTCRVWDIRTKSQIMVLSGHKHTVMTCKSQSYQPQIITGSMDKTIRTWDLRNNGKTLSILTNHKKAIRSIAIHPKQYTFLSGAADYIKVWKCPSTQFIRNMNQRSMSIIDTLSINEDNILISGHQSGHIKFWDYLTGYKFQELRLDPQPGSLDSEAGIMASTFDITGKRLITTESDKTIKMFKQDINATPQTHPINYKINNDNHRY